MPYIARDADGHIVAVSRKPNPKMPEYLPEDHPDLKAALDNARPQIVKKELDEVERKLGRLAEDLLQILITKNIVLFTDLPVDTQDLIYQRNKLASEYNKLISQKPNNATPE